MRGILEISYLGMPVTFVLNISAQYIPQTALSRCRTCYNPFHVTVLRCVCQFFLPHPRKIFRKKSPPLSHFVRPSTLHPRTSRHSSTHIVNMLIPTEDRRQIYTHLFKGNYQSLPLAARHSCRRIEIFQPKRQCV